MTLTPALASRFASLALGHVRREYPNKLDHVINDAHELRAPRELHPLFFGSFDWHSCVHGYWLLARLLRTRDVLPEAGAIRALLDAQLTEANVAAEVAYLRQPNRGTFERPYGWGWLLMLAGELARLDSGEGRRWAAAIQPLAAEFVARFRAFLPKATYPIRSGAHFNTAFAMVLAFDYAATAGDAALAALLRERATGWYGGDEDCQAWEPGGDDFLSPALIEAECMRRALSAADFPAWFARFLPRLAAGEPATLFAPATVSDRTDGKIAHLDGLNFTRAWCWRSLAAALEPGDPRRRLMEDAAGRHVEASLSHVAGDYMGEHWLATFALLALTA
jgi:hypothetical protein